MSFLDPVSFTGISAEQIPPKVHYAVGKWETDYWNFTKQHLTPSNCVLLISVCFSSLVSCLHVSFPPLLPAPRTAVLDFSLISFTLCVLCSDFLLWFLTSFQQRLLTCSLIRSRDYATVWFCEAAPQHNCAHYLGFTTCSFSVSGYIHIHTKTATFSQFALTCTAPYSRQTKSATSWWP